MWAYYSVCSEVADIVNNASHIDTLDAFILKVPKESSGTAWCLAHHDPVVIESCAVASVIETMQELCRHRYLRLAQQHLCLAPRAVVLGLHAMLVGPWIKHGALLQIPFMEDWVKLHIEASLIAVVPEND